MKNGSFQLNLNGQYNHRSNAGMHGDGHKNHSASTHITPGPFGVYLGWHRTKNRHPHFQAQNVISCMLANITTNFRKSAENDLFFVFSKWFPKAAVFSKIAENWHVFYLTRVSNFHGFSIEITENLFFSKLVIQILVFPRFVEKSTLVATLPSTHIAPGPFCVCKICGQYSLGSIFVLALWHAAQVKIWISIPSWRNV